MSIDETKKKTKQECNEQFDVKTFVGRGGKNNSKKTSKIYGDIIFHLAKVGYILGSVACYYILFQL